MADDQIFLGSVFTNTDVVPIQPNDVLIRDLTLDNGVTRTTSIASNLVVGVALAGADPGHQVSVATIMGQRVTLRILNGAIVARGDRLVTDNTAGLVRVDNAAPIGQIIAVATRAKTAGGGTLVEGILVAGGSGVSGLNQTLTQAYGFGTLAADQTLSLLDTKGGGFTINGTSGSFTGTNTFRIQNVAGETVSARLTGFFGVNTAAPTAELHATGATPAFRLEAPGLVAEMRNTGTRLAFNHVTSVVALGFFDLASRAFYAKGGLVPGETAIASVANTISIPSDPAAVVGAAGFGRIRYNAGATRFEVSIEGGAYVPLATGVSAISGSIAASQVAYGSGANTITGTANFTWDTTVFSLIHGAGTTGGILAKGGDTLARSRFRLESSDAAVDGEFRVNGGTVAGSNLGYLAAGQVALETTPAATSAFIIATKTTAPIGFAIDSTQYMTLGVAQLSLLSGKMQFASGSAAAVSPAATGAIRYNESTNRMQFSTNGGAWTDFSLGASALTLAQGYLSGTLASDQTLVLTDVQGGPFVIDASGGGFTGTNAFKIDTAAGDFTVLRASGYVGINETTPVADLHMTSVTPTFRMEHEDGTQSQIFQWEAQQFALVLRDVTDALDIFSITSTSVVLVNGTFRLLGGTEGAPAIGESGLGTTGIFWPTTTSMGFSTNGTERLLINSAGVFDFSNADSEPGSNPTAGYFLYAFGGALKGRGTSGTVTTIGPAEPHCPACGKDYMAEFDNAKYGHFAVCLSCMSAEFGAKPWIVRGPSKLM